MLSLLLSIADPGQTAVNAERVFTHGAPAFEALLWNCRGYDPVMPDAVKVPAP